MTVSIFSWMIFLPPLHTAIGQHPLMDWLRHSLVCCLNEIMDASLSSPAAWSQNTELLVKRWLIFPNGTVPCIQGFDHHVFISIDQRPHYLGLGNWLFVIEQRLAAFWASIDYMESIWKRKIENSLLPRTHREIMKAGAWSRAPLLLSTPAGGSDTIR